MDQYQICVLDLPANPSKSFVDLNRRRWGKLCDGRIFRQHLGKTVIFDRNDPSHYELIACVKVREVF